MKKLCALVLSACFAFGVGASLVACGDSDAPAQTAQDTVTNGYLTLNSYAETLVVGQSFTLKVTKVEDGKETAIKSLQIESEADKTVSVEGNTLTALHEGGTYVHVKADGYSAACFVTVTKATGSAGATIRVSEGKLYNGISAQAQAYVSVGEKLIHKATEVVWSVVGEGTVTADGVITPTATQESITVKASFSHEGTPYETTQEWKVVKPIYYAPSSNEVQLAAAKTLSGETNDEFLTCSLGVKAFNIVSGEEEPLEGVTVSASVQGESVAITEKENYEYELTSVGEGESYVIFKVNGEPIPALCTVATPVSTIADMDILAMASLTEENYKLLAGNYVLMNDIDYEGQIILPIAVFGFDFSLNNRVPGYQWKHWLSKTDGGYEMVDRTQVGKSGGLSDEEFIAFAKTQGVNAAKRTFSGTFDGNGYSIKNATIFYGAVVNPKIGSDPQLPCGYADAVFGYLSGKLCNIAFEGITLQNPADYTASGDTWDITKVYMGGELKENALGLTNGKYLLRGGAIVAWTQDGAELENVYAEIDYAGFEQDSGYKNGGLVLMSNKATLRNCVVKATNVPPAYYAYGGHDNTSSTYVENCFAIGVERFETKIAADALSKNGNYWTKETDWTALLSLSATGKNPTVAQTIDTFDKSVWDFSGLQNNERPQLVKGCWANK